MASTWVFTAQGKGATARESLRRLEVLVSSFLQEDIVQKYPSDKVLYKIDLFLDNVQESHSGVPSGGRGTQGAVQPEHQSPTQVPQNALQVSIIRC